MHMYCISHSAWCVALGHLALRAATFADSNYELNVCVCAVQGYDTYAQDLSTSESSEGTTNAGWCAL